MTERTKTLSATSDGIAEAAALLQSGRLVAFPTETVYGLGADATNGKAVAAIYEAKGRPSFNPLIVHVKDLAAAHQIGAFPKAAQRFLSGGWPDGLSLVVPLRPDTGVSPLVTAGQATVALRMPSAQIARQLLQAFDGPVAAPSANPSGRISPTSARHVLSGLDGKIAAVLDGGATTAGLESTIIGFESGDPVVLREGVYQVPDDLPRKTVADEAGQVAHAPGQLASHYAPLGHVRLNAETALPDEWHLGFGDIAGDRSLSEKGDLYEAAATLFAALHEADANGVTRIAVAPIPNTGLGRAINDRLSRAAAPR